MVCHNCPLEDVQDATEDYPQSSYRLQVVRVREGALAGGRFAGRGGRIATACQWSSRVLGVREGSAGL